ITESTAMSSNNIPTSSNNKSSAIPYRSSRWPARYLIWTGIVHTIYGFINPRIRVFFNDAVKAGYFNQFVGDYARCNAFWFYLAGVNFIVMGRFVDWYLFPKDVERKKVQGEKEREKKQSLARSEKELPRELGYWFLGIGVVGVAALPKSGFYLMIFQGAALLLAK
ncbi:hypothetical protein BGZ95_008273, partial [Linnemannia exigua]